MVVASSVVAAGVAAGRSNLEPTCTCMANDDIHTYTCIHELIQQIQNMPTHSFMLRLLQQSTQDCNYKTAETVPWCNYGQNYGSVSSSLAYLLGVVSMHLHQLADVKPGGTQDLDLPHKHTLKGVDATALLLNVLTCNMVTCLTTELLQLILEQSTTRWCLVLAYADNASRPCIQAGRSVDLKRL